MTTPVLMVVDEDAGNLETLDGSLRRRYGQDYLIVSEASAAAALGRLAELRAAGRPVALVMAASPSTGRRPRSSSPRPAASSRPPSGCSWSREAARPRPACVFRCRWWQTGRRPCPSCAR